MPIFVSEPARPGPQRLPETLRRRRVTETGDIAESHSTAPHQYTSFESASPDQRLARRAASGYQKEAAENLSPDQPYLPVSQIVLGNIVTVQASARFSDARAEMLQHGIHHLVVVHEGTVVGLVDMTWILERELLKGGESLLGDELLPSFITATPETDAHDLARQMLGYQIPSAIVIDQRNQATGVVTATDYLRLYAQKNAMHEAI